ncbi:MAG: choice-of-anchor tandem repeat GloVer-containing protein [Candidatus Sulfotelmatobacter sp.]
MAFALLVFCAAMVIASPAQIFTTLVDFNGTDGDTPGGALVQGTDGNLYGATGLGGAANDGTVFRITPAGTLTTLYSFDRTDGSSPSGALVQAADGNFYGTTGLGGAANDGTVFRITPAGTLTTLHSFAGADGELPYAGLVQAANGDFYGTTYEGGAANDGTVFRITPAGTLTTLYSFCSQANCTDGYNPSGGLVQATNGNLYGTTDFGGADETCPDPNGCGTAFEITPAGELTTLQSSFTFGYPWSGVVQGISGNFYGTANGATSAIFEMTPSGTLTVLGTTCCELITGLVQASGGAFYGVTYQGGTANDGTIFKITPAGELTTLYNFCPQAKCSGGAYPNAGLMQATNGIFYGSTTGEGHGLSNNGSIFSLSTGLPPFVATRPSSGDVGAAVIILGTDLTGSTAVTFNGTAATFNVVSASEITTTVPAGASSGAVEVTTSSGTLKSNVAFRVVP